MISVFRIDERLMHGQICTQWVSYAHANTIVLVDDATANDPFLTLINTSQAPKGAVVKVFSVETAKKELVKMQDDDSIKALVIFKGPAICLQLMEGGVRFTELNVGNMGGANGRKTYTSTIRATDEEIELFRQIRDKGVKMYAQLLPDMKSEDFGEIIK